MKGINVSVVNHVHKYNVILIKIVNVMIAIALIHMCVWG